MKNVLKIAAFAAIVMPLATPGPVFAQSSGYHDNDRHDDRTYRGNDSDYRHKCGGGNGAVGTVAGGAGGALAGNALGGGTLGTVAGGVGGALLGRHFDKQHTRHKNGC